MAKSKKRKAAPIHPSIKERLGYEATDSDEDVYADWKERVSRVCKPCWELKYCPYGPLVEQLPTLPPLREGSEEKINYFKNCLETNLVGSVVELTDEIRARYEAWLEDEDVLLHQVWFKIRQRKTFEALEKIEGEDEQLDAWLGNDIPAPHIYRVPYDLGLDATIEEADFEPEVWAEIEQGVEDRRSHLLAALEAGVSDDRHPLEPVRRIWFQRQVDSFSLDDYPESIPQTFLDGECNVFGHICPVFFAAEITTETEEERRIGRRSLSFTTMMRIVRRDDYRCQHCHKKLRDDEVEFDHKIPVSKGGSSEEHNMRLTCFDCNRDKSDDYTP